MLIQTYDPTFIFSPLGCLILCSFIIVRNPLADGFSLFKIPRTFNCSILSIPFPITIRLIIYHLAFGPNSGPIRMVFNRLPINNIQFLFFNAVRMNQVTFFIVHSLNSSNSDNSFTNILFILFPFIFNYSYMLFHRLYKDLLIFLTRCTCKYPPLLFKMHIRITSTLNFLFKPCNISYIIFYEISNRAY